MSVAQIERELVSLDETELQSLEDALRREKGRRSGRVLGAVESRLFEVINQPMPGSERFRQLEPSWEAGTLSEDERAELLAIVEQREEQNVVRVEAVMELARIRGVEFKSLWRQIMGPTPAPRLVLG